MLSNNPPSAAELFADEIASLKARIEAFGPITDANAGEARDLIGLAKKLAKDIDAKRDEEKRPHLEAGRQIDATFKPLVDAANAAPAPLSKALLDHISEQKRKAAEAERIAREKAEAEAARARQLADDDLMADDAAEAAEAAETEARLVSAEAKMAGTVKGSEGFRAAGVRVSYRAKVTDWNALVASMVNHPDVMAAAEKAANAAIRAAKGVITIPGVTVETVESLV